MKSKKRPYYILIHPLYLIGLVLLISNDWYFKGAFHNFWTGKLSDFAGLFIFPIFFAVLFPKRIKTVHIVTALGFIFWKTEASQPFLDWVLQLGWTIERVVDYSDLIALSVIPCAYVFYQKQISVVEKLTFQFQPILINSILIISFFAFCATSPIHRPMLIGGDYNMEKDFRTATQDSFVIEQLKASDLEVEKGLALPGRFNQYFHTDTLPLNEDGIAIDTIAEYLANNWHIKNFPVKDDTIPYLNIVVYTSRYNHSQDRKKNTTIYLKGICTKEGQTFKPKEIKKMERYLKRKIKRRLK